MARVLVVGGGLAGLHAAVSAAEAGAEVALASKVHPLSSASVAATGGINAALGADDSWQIHAEDTLKASAGLADRDAVERVCREAAGEVRRLDGFGVPFNRDAEGKLGAKVVSGSRHARTIFAGDHTGKAMLQALWQRAHRLRVAMHEEEFLLRLVVDGGRCRGAVFLKLATGEVVSRPADAVVVATGGLGRLYAPTTNPVIATGDGTAAALRAGAALEDMEMTQFYPTCFPGSGICVTEEARVHGGILVNGAGERFMARVAPEAMEMANRDLLSRAIFAERARGEEVFLDCRGVPIEGGLRVFAELSRGLLGVDVATQRLPVIPGFHYQMGGIATDVDGRTAVPGLYAAGECACVSVHGGNRVGANSLLETLVMGRAAGGTAAGEGRHADSRSVDEAAAEEQVRVAVLREQPPHPAQRDDGREVSRLHGELRRTMAEHVGIIRDEEGLGRADQELARLDQSVAQLGAGDSSLAYNQALRRRLELANLLLLGRAVVASARSRRESRGAHFRADHPSSDPVALHRLVWRRGETLHVEEAPVRTGSSSEPLAEPLAEPRSERAAPAAVPSGARA